MIKMMNPQQLIFPEYIILQSYKNPETNEYECLALAWGNRQDLLNILEKLQEEHEQRNVFMVSETCYGTTIDQEYATKELGYVFSLILLDKKSMIKQIKKQKTINA